MQPRTGPLRCKAKRLIGRSAPTVEKRGEVCHRPADTKNMLLLMLPGKIIHCALLVYGGKGADQIY